MEEHRPTDPVYTFPAVPAIILLAVGWLVVAAIIGWIISLPFRLVLSDSAAETIGFPLGLVLYAYWTIRYRAR